MINRRLDSTRNQTRVTFTLSEDRPVSVVGDFNDWDPLAHPLQGRSNGLRSVGVDFPTGRTLRFRYLVDGGEYLDEPDADRVEHNGYGTTDNVVVAALPDEEPVR